MNATGTGEFMTTAELAERLSVKKETLSHMHTAGAIPRGFQLGRGLRWMRADVEAWLAESQARGRLLTRDEWDAVKEARAKRGRR
jgi:excisionase family DNA binding protein